MAEQEAHPLTGDTAQVNQPLTAKKAPKPAPKEIPKREGCCAPWEWFTESPLHRWQFGVFLVWSILPVVWIAIRFGSSLTADLLAGIFALVLAIYGANHFRILLGLKVEVDRFADNNKRFKEENMQLKTEVSKLSKASDELSEIQHRLTETSKAFSQNIEKFAKLDATLSQLADDNIEGIEKLKDMSHMVQTSIQNELLQHERSILMKVMDKMEFGDDKEGLNRQEYQKFVEALPGTFQRRFSAMQRSFTQVAGNDSIMDFQEFTKLCDEFAKQEASAGGTTIDPIARRQLETIDSNK
eukprot:119139_1